MTLSNFFKIFIISLSFFIGFLNFHAIASEKDSGIYTYIFHLWYDDGKLTTDYDVDFPFDLAAKEYQTISTPKDSYSGKIISIKNSPLATVYFSPTSLVSGTSGKLSLEAPYFPNAKTAIFYDALGKELLTIDLAPSGPLCNEDGVCNANFGEDNQNCPADCQKINVEPKITPPINEEKGASSLIILAMVLGLLAIAITVWIIVKKRRS